MATAFNLELLELHVLSQIYKSHVG